MVRSALVLLALVAAPAWAVGERVSLPKGSAFADQLKETLCISMECGAGTDASITAKVIKGNKVELKVFAATGNLKATVTAPLNAEGRISSMDLVAATSGLIKGIEAADPGRQAPPAKAKKGFASKSKKKSSFKMAAKARSGHSRG